MLFSKNINLFNQGSRTQQIDRQDYYMAVPRYAL